MLGTISKKDNNNTKLSVAIPTFNGSRYIRETLDSIISQLEDIDEEVEIVVSDNASTDQTPRIIREYQKKYPFIKYFCNDENLGADINFDLAVKRSRGNFVWIMADDDLMHNGAISKVLSIISSEKEIVYISLNYSYCDRALTKLLIERAIPKKHDMLLTSVDDFVMFTLPGFVSSNIVRKDNWLSVKTEKYYGTWWIHLAVILEYLPGHKFYFVGSPFVIRRDYTKWVGGGKEFYTFLNLKKILSNLPVFGYKKRTVNFLINNMAKDLPKTVFGAKIRGLTVSVKGFKKLIKEFLPYPIHYSLSLFIYMFPRSVLHLFHRLIRSKFSKPFKSAFAKMGFST